MQVRLQRFNLKLLIAFVSILGAAYLAPLMIGQDASFLSPDVVQVGAKLACRCGGCRNTVGDCPMMRCSSADPLRHQIYTLKQKGLSDSAVVNTIVREQGIVALASPPSEGLGPLVTWFMPGLVLLTGFFIYWAFVRRHRKEPAPLTASDQTLIDQYRDQINHEFEDEEPRK